MKRDSRGGRENAARSGRPPRNSKDGTKHRNSTRRNADQRRHASAKPSPRGSRGSIRTSQRPLAPQPSDSIPAVYVSAKILHPLIYRKRVQRVDQAKPGDFVAVYNADSELSGYGLYNPHSELAVRMLWYGETFPGEDAWRTRLEQAVKLREESLGLGQFTDAYRLVHAEADELSGLVADRFGDVISIEAFSLGMYQRAEAIARVLMELCDAKHYVVQSSPQFSSQEGSEPPTLRSENLPHQLNVQEYGTRFRLRFEGGHKTGFFCDQRENRRRLADFCQDKTVLDLCCYTGGFSVQAAKLGQARQVTGVDLDQQPLVLAKENANLNQVRCRFVQADAFAYMREMLGNQRQFDVVVLDPPKLIRTRSEMEEGVRKHFALNRLAMQLVKPGGLLLTCSCAGLLPEPEFVRLLVSAARRAGDETAGSRGRTIKFLAKTGAASDHPVIGSCLETEYLKAAWLLVD